MKLSASTLDSFARCAQFYAWRMVTPLWRSVLEAVAQELRHEAAAARRAS